MARHIRGFGWKRDTHNPLDISYRAREIAVPAQPPRYMRRPEWCAPVSDQGNTNSCTAHGGVRCMVDTRLEQGLPTEPLSRLELYWNTRAREHTTDEDSGAQIRSTIDTLHTLGVAPESLWPFDESKILIQPPANVVKAGLQNLALRRERIDNGNLNLLKNALAATDDPVIFGALVWPEIQNLPSSGILPMPGPMSNSLGGHCMVAEGYDDSVGNDGCFWVANSWGEDYGLKGYLWVPYPYLTNKTIANDFWHVELVGSSIAITGKGRTHVRRRK